MASDLPINHPAEQNDRPPIQPALPNFSLLFRSRAGERFDSTSIDSTTPKINESAAERQQQPTPISETAETPNASTDCDEGQTESTHHGSPEENTVSASTASPSGPPSVSTPATQELAAEVPSYPLHNGKEVVSADVQAEDSEQAAEHSDEADISVAEPSNNEDTRLLTKETEYDNHTVNIQIDQSESASAEVEDDQQALASSSATSLGVESDDKVTAQPTNPSSQYIPDGYTTFLTTEAENLQSFPQSSTSYAAQALPTPRVSTIPALHEYFLHVAASKDYADWLIQVHSPTTKGESFPTYAHSIVLLRSARMRRLLTRQQSTYGTNVLDLYPPRYVIPHAFESALRFFYSDEVIAKDFFLQQPAGVDSQASRLYHLDYILSYWISGIELGLDTISDRAETLLSDYLDWDLVETAYKAASDIAKSEIESNTKHATGTDYFVMSKSIIRLVLNFIVSRLDLNKFTPDTAATTSVLSPLLPQADDNRSRTNPALASMVFGSMPSSTGVSPVSPQSDLLTSGFIPRDTVASNILLNLDFENLHRFNTFLQRRGGQVADRIMTEVVEAREARRQKVLNAQAISNGDRMAASARWDVVGHQESFANGVLTEKRVGFLLPSSK